MGLFVVDVDSRASVSSASETNNAGICLEVASELFGPYKTSQESILCGKRCSWTDFFSGKSTLVVRAVIWVNRTTFSLHHPQPVVGK
jgi:hypothetical protein